MTAPRYLKCERCSIFAIDPDVNADAICVSGHQFGLLCTTFHAKGRRGLVQAIH